MCFKNNAGTYSFQTKSKNNKVIFMSIILVKKNAPEILYATKKYLFLSEFGKKQNTEWQTNTYISWTTDF